MYDHMTASNLLLPMQKMLRTDHEGPKGSKQ